MEYIKYISLFLLFNLTACSPLQTYLNTDTTAFYKDTFTTKGSIVVLAGDINLNNSLEFDLYKQKVHENLKAVGFSIADNIQTADFAALLLYAVDDGKQSVVYTPIYGQTTRRIDSYSDIAYDEKVG